MTVSLLSSSCHGQIHEALVDMSGNVAEWVDACDTDGKKCRVRGGSYSSSDESLRCDAAAHELRTDTSRAVGFRCCS